MSQAKPFWEPLELALQLNVPPGRLYGWIYEGRLLAVKQGDRMLIPACEADRLMKRGRRNAKPRNWSAPRHRPKKSNDPNQRRLDL